MTLAWKPLSQPNIRATNWFTSKNQSSYSCAINFPHSFLFQASFHLPMSGLEWFVRKQYDSRQEASPTLRSTCFLTSIIQSKQSAVQLFSVQEWISNRFGTLMAQKNRNWLFYKNGTDIWGCCQSGFLSIVNFVTGSAILLVKTMFLQLMQHIPVSGDH